MKKTIPMGPGKDRVGLESSDRLKSYVEIVDHCLAAQATANALGETFLSYMLDMAIQETRGAMRRGTIDTLSKE